MLTLVKSDETQSPEASQGGNRSADRHATGGELRAEALAIEASHGKNPYSEFLIKHGKRPDSRQAAVIGRLLGGRVMASDGSMQPRLTKGEQAAVRDIRRRRKVWSQHSEHALLLGDAIIALSANEQDPIDLVDYLNIYFDEQAISDQVEDALVWLQRFAKEWNNRGQNQSSRD